MTKNNNEPPKEDKKDIVQDNFSLEKTPSKTEKASPSLALRALLILLLFLSGSATGIYFLPSLKERLPIISTWTGESDAEGLSQLTQSIANQQRSITTLERSSAEQAAQLNQLSASSQADQPQLLESRLSKLEESLSVPTVDPSVTIDSSQSTRIDMLLSRMSQLEAAFIPLSKNMIDGVTAENEREQLKKENTSLTKNITILESRLAALESRAARDNSGILLNMKIAELKKKVVSGSIYNEELNAVKRLVENGALRSNMALSNALSALEERASNGLTTPSQLKKRFNDLIPNMITTTSGSNDASWWQSTLDRIQNMVSVRNTDNNSLGLDGMIAQTESWLESEEMDSALAAINELPSTLQQLLADWKADLEYWLKGEEAIDTIETIAAENYLVASNSFKNGTYA
jgi:hypothetical protein